VTLRRYASPTELLHGPGSLAKLADEVRRLGGTKVVIVSDPGLSGAGVTGRVEAPLREAGIPHACYYEVPTDPTFEDVDRIVGLIRADGADTVVSLGGGSALAAGRSAAVAATHGGSSRALAGIDKATERPLLSICIPTTAGSGGEVSRQATLTEDSGHKSGIQGWSVAARLAVLDAELLVSVPRRQAVASGVDALTHALEAYVSRRATPLTDALALSSFETLFNDLPTSIESRQVDVLDRVLLASSVANIACGNAGLGLVHGLNKGITYLFHTGRYATVSYGDLHAVLLPWVLAFNLPAAPARFATLARLMGVSSSGSDEQVARAGIDRLKDWLAALDAPRRLPWEDCPPEDLDLAVNDVVGRAMANDNPRESTADDLRAIVRDCIRGW
jgi:alcohol dehydrogenase class IV